MNRVLIEAKKVASRLSEPLTYTRPRGPDLHGSRIEFWHHGVKLVEISIDYDVAYGPCFIDVIDDDISVKVMEEKQDGSL